MKKAQDGVQAAIQKQKEKRAAIQAASDARKEKAMAPRRAKGLPATPKTGKTTLPAGEGSMKKYMNAGTNPFGSTKGPVKVGGKPDAPASAPKKTGSAGGGKRKVARTAAVAITAPKMKTSAIGPAKPSVPGVSAKPAPKELSKTESKMAAEIQKMRSGKTSTEAGQARIKALKAKDTMSKQRAMRKEKRAAIKAVKQSYKK